MCLPKASFMVSMYICVLTWDKECCCEEREILASGGHLLKGVEDKWQTSIKQRSLTTSLDRWFGYIMKSPI